MDNKKLTDEEYKALIKRFTAEAADLSDEEIEARLTKAFEESFYADYCK